MPRGFGMRRCALLVMVAIVSLALVATTAGCGGGGADKSLARVKKAKQMVFGTDATYPPMEYSEKNQVIGFDIDLANAICEILGVKAKFEVVEWGGIIPGLTAKKYDAIISSMNVTDERKKSVNFSDPYLVVGQVLVVKKGATGIAKLEDLAGKKIAVQIGTTNEDVAKGIKGVKDKDIARFNSFVDCFVELANGKVDAVIVDEPVGKYYLTLKPNVYQLAGQPFESAPMGIAIRKEDVKLLEAVNKALSDMKKSGKYNTITKKWFGTP
jgi:polar amino acid transport system substrate-binding protein